MSADAADLFLATLDAQTSPRPPPSTDQAVVLKNGIRYSHSAMIDMLIAEPWLRQNDLARRFGRSASWISTIMASDAWQAAWAARKETIVDPGLRMTVEENTKGLYLRSLDVLREKFDRPTEMIPDQLAIQTLAQTARALGYGARPADKVEVNITNQIESHGDNLVRLLRRTKASLATEEIIDGEVTGTGSSTYLPSREAHSGNTQGRLAAPVQQSQLPSEAAVSADGSTPSPA